MLPLTQQAKFGRGKLPNLPAAARMKI